jgi:hypothetical protein
MSSIDAEYPAVFLLALVADTPLVVKGDLFGDIKEKHAEKTFSHISAMSAYF